MCGRLARLGRNRLGRWAPALLLLGAALLYLLRLGSVGLFDPTEGTYAEISREMLLLGNWLTPHFNFIPYFEKPPLLFWLNALAFRAFGLSEFSARLSTALAAVTGVGFVYCIGRDLWSRRAGLAAGAVLTTSFGYFVFGRMILPDMLFVSLLTAAFWGFSRLLLDEAPPRAALPVAYAAMGGTVLAKGLIGIVFPALSIGAFLLLTRDWRLLRRLQLVRGGAIFLLITAPWHALVAWRNPGFLSFYFINEHLNRFLGHRLPLDYTSLPVGTYLALTVAWFCPWSVFLPAAIRRCWPRTLSGGRAERGSLLVLLWGGTVIGFFALSASRLEYYALPALPALALCVGRLWDSEAGMPRNQARSGTFTATWVGLIAFALCLVPATYFFLRLGDQHFYNVFLNADGPAGSVRGGLLAAARSYILLDFARLVPLFETVVGLIIVGTAASAWAWFHRRPSLAFMCLVAGMVAGLVTIQAGFVLVEPHRSIVRLAGVLRDELRPGEQILVEGKFEEHASIAFYTGQHVFVYRGMDGDLLFGSRYAEAKPTFMSEQDFARLWRGQRRGYLLSDAPDCLSRLRALAPGTVLLGQTGGNSLFANRGRTN